MTYESDDSRSGSAPGKCLIIGDSMLQKVNPEGWDHEAYYFAYSGIKAKQLTQQIKIEVLPPPKDIGVIFLHVGTNNVSTRADLKEREDVVEPPEIAEDIMNVVDTLRKHYEYAHITVSAILPRLDPWKLGDLDRVNSINGELKRSVNNSYLKNLKFVDFSEHFISNWKIRKECYRFFYERQLDEPDLCHLSDDGNVRLNETLKSYLAGTMHEMRSKWPRDAKIIGQREWEEFRRRTFRSRDNPRFKYTNYLPSQKSYDRYIKSNPRAAEANGDPNPKKSGGGFNIAELLALKAKGRKDAEERAKSGGQIGTVVEVLAVDGIRENENLKSHAVLRASIETDQIRVVEIAHQEQTLIIERGSRTGRAVGIKEENAVLAGHRTLSKMIAISECRGDKTHAIDEGMIAEIRRGILDDRTLTTQESARRKAEVVNREITGKRIGAIEDVASATVHHKIMNLEILDFEVIASLDREWKRNGIFASICVIALT
ncbi:unnamed protein product [Oikopleura dioica]|uniref:Uncharacterized protein n=1 Tax=Oikopleura dioica TaxID=34765 RepID=E4Y2E6_OIKDI|nr:unnamed protein product [Oikopleura dioica]